VLSRNRARTSATDHHAHLDDPEIGHPPHAAPVLPACDHGAVVEQPGEGALGARRPTLVSTDPLLTTIRQPWQRISSEMTRLLLGQIEGDPPAAVILPTELVRRGSS
jgi:Periplasmic binding protein-like domain